MEKRLLYGNISKSFFFFFNLLILLYLLYGIFLFCFILFYVEFCGGRETCYKSISKSFFFLF